ncbi:MAG: tetratricopeptide repeat protein [Lentimicrobiaceae bacterium]|nr:tetratricopeptide repeat protein [Lentimicrobiaceae bacterium]
MKKLFLSIFVLSALQTVGYSQNAGAGVSQNKELFSNFIQLSPQQLFDTANYYYKKNSMDTALICFNLLIYTTPKDADYERQKKVMIVCNRSAAIHFFRCDYRAAYELQIKALLLSEKFNDTDQESISYTNIGSIYYRFNEYDLAKSYFLKSLNLCSDSTILPAILNNIGVIEGENGRTDSAHYFLDKALQLSKLHNNAYLNNILNDIALFYQKDKNYDSAYHYYQLALTESKKQNKIEKEAESLSQLGKLFFETGKNDSALFYINLSNEIAGKNNFLRILADNYLILFKIEKSKGLKTSALYFFEKYANLKDSIFNIERFSEISQLQHSYEVSKTNQQIEQLYIEQQIKERTIQYQKVFLFFTLLILLLVSIGLLYIYFQKRNLGQAYKTLFEKNIQIIELQKKVPESIHEIPGLSRTNVILSEQSQKELLNSILTFMENTSQICNPDFTLEKLTNSIHSNQKYVSFVINNVLKKNFNSFLNSYRVREAQRLFSDSDSSKYTVEFVANQVGFKSRNSFSDAFKEITGVTPGFYVRSLHNSQQD